jgi:hypothetical protein
VSPPKPLYCLVIFIYAVSGGYFILLVPWLPFYVLRIPGLGKDVKAFREFAMSRAVTRKLQGSLTKDLFHHLASLFLGFILSRLTWL